jgi:ribonuclease HI
MRRERIDPPFEVETTKLVTAQREGGKWPVRFRRACSIDPKRTWIFADGSGTGWHAAVIVRPGVEEHRLCRCHATSTRNVGAELDGVILGLEHTLPGERIAVVSDYLWTAYYLNGWWQVRDPYLRERVARAVLQDHRLSGALFVHHPGHQADDGGFSRWNRLADQLCGTESLVDLRIPAPSGNEDPGANPDLSGPCL